MIPKNEKSGGFTLIELLVVIGIIAMLSSIVITGLQVARNKAADAKAAIEMNSLKNALSLYRAKHGTVPYEGVAFPNAILPTDWGGGSSLDTSLSMLVSEGLIAKIPHYQIWQSGVNNHDTVPDIQYAINAPSTYPATWGSYLYTCSTLDIGPYSVATAPKIEYPAVIVVTGHGVFTPKGLPASTCSNDHGNISCSPMVNTACYPIL